MNTEEFEKKMEELKTPKVNDIKEPTEIKLAILNAGRSATIGIWFIVVPSYFLFCVFMKYYFHINLGIFDTMVEMISDLDEPPEMKILSPILIVGLPLIGIVLNALAITHFSFDKVTKILHISIKLRWLNLLVLLISLGLVALFTLYVIVENIHHS